MQAATTPDRRLEDNRRSYEQIVEAVRCHARRGDVEAVLRTAAVAASAAWHAPTGALSDPGLERLVRDAVGGGTERIAQEPADGRVLHVLTEAYAVGGHTRLARRWVERDRRSSDFVLTMQRGEVPASLRETAARTGARIVDLREGFATLTERAEVLRGLMAGAATVVLHVHPYDVVALAAACLPGPRPPIVHENHADHTFWLGLAAADLVVENREIGRQVSSSLRGVPEHRLAELPVPVDPAAVTSSRKAVRARLRLRPGQVAAISVASPMKTAPLWGEGFDQLLARVLPLVPELVVVLAGPSADGAWARLQSQFPGRVFPLGVVEQVQELFAGMDLYLDSYPSGSITSILEAVAAGLPPVSLQLLHGNDRLFCSSAPGLPDDGWAYDDEDAYVAAVRALVQDRDLRRRRGEDARTAVLATHAGQGWVESLEEVYRRAHEAPIADLDEIAEPVRDTAYGNTLLPYLVGDATAAEPAVYGSVLGVQLDERTRWDLLVAGLDRRQRRLSVRIAAGWENHPAWTMGLVRLAREHAWLAVSLPLVGDDDGSGGRSVAVLEPLLAALGVTTDDCGDLTLDPRPPRPDGAVLPGVLAVRPESLEALRLIVTSPLWDDDRVGSAP